MRPLLAERGCTVSPDVRLRSSADVVDHLGASGTTGIVDGTEVRVRRPAAGRQDRDKFVSGENKQNAVKSMAVTDGEGRVLWCGPARPASCADITHATVTSWRMSSTRRRRTTSPSSGGGGS
ncbi:transposase family protein [Streptomyces sp. M92]|uniref:transposase family protein n=1 Tax=Streptomyces sp. M92 TaxID=2944250 RepID=UPI0023495DD0|nr:transposase family protein [Streptomyces sp. M92]WCN05307.1 transposase family protein [Streptomyces sp. M92]